MEPHKVVRKVANKYNAEYVEYPKWYHHSLVASSGWEKVAEDVFSWIETIT